jgi:hypothetical protein
MIWLELSSVGMSHVGCQMYLSDDQKTQLGQWVLGQMHLTWDMGHPNI